MTWDWIRCALHLHHLMVGRHVPIIVRSGQVTLGSFIMGDNSCPSLCGGKIGIGCLLEPILV